MPENALILDGTASGDGDLPPIRNALSQALEAANVQVQTVVLRDTRLAHCVGCFKCWMKTPGICAEADAGRDIARAMVRSDYTVFFTPVTFGGYSPELKKMVDRMVQIASPLFRMEHGEVHHPPRYARPPRLLIVGVQRRPNQAEAHIFRTLAGRNAINMHPPGYAAEVVLASDDPEMLRARFASLLTRSDPLPFGDAAAALMPPPVAPAAIPENGSTRRALLIVGSPKTNEPSTSGALGGYLIGRLSDRGWKTESLTLRASLNRPEGAAELAAAAGNAELILLVFPLYVDSLPHMVMRALTILAGSRAHGAAPQRLMAVVNSGFPEAHQNAVAMAICREFAAQSGLTWAGGLVLPGGGVVGGQPLTDARRSGPPVRRVVSALDQTADALAAGFPVPAAAVKMMAKSPLPVLWRPLYAWLAEKSFEKLAVKNGLTKEQLRARPYAA